MSCNVLLFQTPNAKWRVTDTWLLSATVGPQSLILVCDAALLAESHLDASLTGALWNHSGALYMTHNTATEPRFNRTTIYASRVPQVEGALAAVDRRAEREYRGRAE